MWCGKSWADVLTTSITLGSLTESGKEKIENGDHEMLTMCHLCICVIILESVANMSTSSSGDGDGDIEEIDDDDNDVGDDDSNDVTGTNCEKEVWKLLPPPESKSSGGGTSWDWSGTPPREDK